MKRKGIRRKILLSLCTLALGAGLLTAAGYFYLAARADIPASQTVSPPLSEKYSLTLLLRDGLEITLAEPDVFDQEALHAILDRLFENSVPPADARLVIENNSFSIVPAQKGNTLKKEEFFSLLQEVIESRETSFSPEEHQLYLDPSLLETDPALLQKQRELNEFLDCSVTYTLPGQEQLILDRETLIQWISQDESGGYYLDNAVFEKKLLEFVENLAARVDTYKKECTFSSTLHGSYTLVNNSFGWGLANSKELEQLRGEIQSHSHLTREPVYYSRGLDTKENGGLGTTYIEVDMSAQHMWYYENGVCRLESDIVTGTMVPDRYTPEGIFTIYNMVPGKYLIGENIPGTNTPSYKTWVDYWMPFNGAIGLHDADWNYTNGNGGFGKDYYIYNGSHGCVNLPSEAAAQLYSMLQIGTPVICYYPEGYSLHG